jgi:glycosyltransferase involved in cell wall biosynthesis
MVLQQATQMAPRNPAVTVIIATFNSSASLRYALASVLNQTFGDFEVWIIGDGCTDDSAAVVSACADARVHWVNLDRNHGSQAMPNNEGLRRARGRAIAYLGHDDLWLPHHLDTLMARVDATGADLVHSQCCVIGPVGVVSCMGPPRPGTGYAWHFVPPSAWLHRRDLVDRIGPWSDPETLAWPVDMDVMRRAALAGMRIENCDRITLLKFPSATFRTYAPDGRPQPQYWARIQQDPGQAERDVMTAVARLAPHEPHWFRSLARRLRQRLIAIPAFHAIERKRFQALRRRARSTRGLH